MGSRSRIDTDVTRRFAGHRQGEGFFRKNGVMREIFVEACEERGWLPKELGDRQSTYFGFNLDYSESEKKLEIATTTGFNFRYHRNRSVIRLKYAIAPPGTSDNKFRNFLIEKKEEYFTRMKHGKYIKFPGEIHTGICKSDANLSTVSRSDEETRKDVQSLFKEDFDPFVNEVLKILNEKVWPEWQKIK